jgi:hypothetical protein
VLLAATCLLDRRPLAAGTLVGVGYLMHPVALMSVPALLLMALWPFRQTLWRHPQALAALKLLAGVGFFFLLWRLLNGSHYSQSGFFSYVTEAGPSVHATPWGEPSAWFSHRLESLGNTLVPMMLSLAHGDNPSINFFGGTSPTVIHVFFQYWNTLPFGVAIVFFPLLLLSLWRAAVRWPWPTFVAVVVPFLTFVVYWGSYTTGMLPEGLQTWVVTLLAVVAVQQTAAGCPWLRSRLSRTVLTLRVAEMLAVVLTPTVATRHLVISSQYRLVDSAALLGVFASCACLALLVWRNDLAAPPPGPRPGRR